MNEGNETDIRLVRAETEEEYFLARTLFLEYAGSLGVDLSFQDFEAEMADLAGEYGPPEGIIFLAESKAGLGGVVAVRPFEPGVAEMKRLYVAPEGRGLGVGKMLARAAVEFAREAGYRAIRLDTLAFMTEAIGLYEAMGFKRISPYRYNPFQDAVYLELDLT